MSSKKKKHHYLPQFYVGSFSNEKKEVYVFDKETGKTSKQGKKGTFHLKHFYSVDFSKHKARSPESIKKLQKILGIENVDTSHVKEYPDMIEDLLGESESIAAKVINKLSLNEKISDLDKNELSTFIALMYARTPTFREFSIKIEKELYEASMAKIFSSKEKMVSIYDRMKKDGYTKEFDADELLKFYKEKRYRIEIPQELIIQNMLMVVPMIDKIIYEKTWLILEAPPNSSGFVTSDNPVFLFHSQKNELSKTGFETPDVEIVFPLSKKCLLLMKSTPNGKAVLRKRIPQNEVTGLNNLIMANSGKYIISSNESSLSL